MNVLVKMKAVGAILSHEITHLDGIITIYLDAIMTCFVSDIGKYPIIILSECVNVYSKRIIVFFFQNDSLLSGALLSLFFLQHTANQSG